MLLIFTGGQYRISNFLFLLTEFSQTPNLQSEINCGFAFVGQIKEKLFIDTET